MRDAVHRLMDELLRAIVADEGIAREFAEIAHACRQAGGRQTADGFLNLARHHRVKALEARARAAALGSKYHRYPNGGA